MLPDLYLPLGAAAFVSSFLTACMGVGGGAFLLLVMAFYFPPAILIPLHGVVQLGSNLGRILTLWRVVNPTTIAFFTLGTLIGNIVGAQVFFSLPEQFLSLIIGLGVLVLTWLPKPKKQSLKTWGLSFVGAITGFLGLFIGAAGILVAPYISRGLTSRHAIVGTQAAVMTIQNIFKLAVFLFAGFAFSDYALLLTIMLSTGLMGTLAGRYLVLDKISDKSFSIVFKIMLTLLALHTIYRALST